MPSRIAGDLLRPGVTLPTDLAAASSKPLAAGPAPISQLDSCRPEACNRGETETRRSWEGAASNPISVLAASPHLRGDLIRDDNHPLGGRCEPDCGSLCRVSVKGVKSTQFPFPEVSWLARRATDRHPSGGGSAAETSRLPWRLAPRHEPWGSAGADLRGGVGLRRAAAGGRGDGGEVRCRGACLRLDAESLPPSRTIDGREPVPGDASPQRRLHPTNQLGAWVGRPRLSRSVPQQGCRGRALPGAPGRVHPSQPRARRPGPPLGRAVLDQPSSTRRPRSGSSLAGDSGGRSLVRRPRGTRPVRPSDATGLTPAARWLRVDRRAVPRRSSAPSADAAPTPRGASTPWP